MPAMVLNRRTTTLIAGSGKTGQHLIVSIPQETVGKITAFHYLLKIDLVPSSANFKGFNFASNIDALAINLQSKEGVLLSHNFLQA